MQDCNLRCDDTHMCRGHKRVFSAGNIATNGFDRNIIMAEHNSGKRLRLDISHGGTLYLGENANLGLRKLDVIQFPARELRQALLNLLLRQTERGWIPLVELLRDFAQGSLTAGFDVLKNPSDDIANLLRFGLGLRERFTSLQMLCHYIPLDSWPFRSVSDFAALSPAQSISASTGVFYSTATSHRQSSPRMWPA